MPYVTPPLYRETNARLNSPVAGARRLRGGRVLVAEVSSPRQSRAELGDADPKPAFTPARSDADLPPSSRRQRRGVTATGVPNLPVPVDAHPVWSPRRVVEASHRFVLSVPTVPVGPDPNHMYIGADEPKSGPSNVPSTRRGFRAAGANLTSKSKGRKEARNRSVQPAGPNMLFASPKRSERADRAIDNLVTRRQESYF
jgi:hypothetical protein